jgi:hypothetical protein
MRNILFALALIISAQTALAQFIQVDPSIYDAMDKLIQGHTDSPGVQKMKAKIESEYGVTCQGDTQTIFPDITKRVKYVAHCKGKTSLKLEVTSKFSYTKTSVAYEVKKFSVKFK